MSYAISSFFFVQATICGCHFINITDATNPFQTTDYHICEHGHPTIVKGEEPATCQCDEGWSMAGITDTIHFLQGTCSQYRCSSDEKCYKDTGLSDASCVVPGWNCLCPFKYALQSSLMGYETFHDVYGEGTGGWGCCITSAFRAHQHVHGCLLGAGYPSFFSHRCLFQLDKSVRNVRTHIPVFKTLHM